MFSYARMLITWGRLSPQVENEAIMRVLNVVGEEKDVLTSDDAKRGMH